jgi:AcrR family transcriptional regulator
MSPDDRRAQIVAVAREVFAEFGYSGTKIRMVAQRAGITEPLLYRHFHSKESLYEEAFLHPLDSFIEGLAAETHDLATRTDISRSEVLRHFHELFLAHLVPVTSLVGMSLFFDADSGEAGSGDPVFPRVHALVSEVFADLSGLTADKLGADSLARSLMGLYFGLAVESDFDDAVLDPAATARQLTWIFAPGLTGVGAWRPTPKPLPEGFGAFDLEALPDAGGRSRIPRAERRKLVQAEARQVFVERGFTGATSKELARRAGVTEAILYRLFDGKDELYLEAVERPVQRAVAEFATQARMLATDRSGPDLLQGINELGIRFFVRHAQLVAASVLARRAEGERLYREALRPSLLEIEDVILQRVGISDSRLEPGFVRRALMGAQLGIAFDRRLADRPDRIADAAAKLTLMFVGGIRPAGRGLGFSGLT